MNKLNTYRCLFCKRFIKIEHLIADCSYCDISFYYVPNRKNELCLISADYIYNLFDKISYFIQFNPILSVYSIYDEDGNAIVDKIKIPKPKTLKELKSHCDQRLEKLKTFM